MRVRCTNCKSVFVVKKDAGPAQPLGGGSSNGQPRGSDPFGMAELTGEMSTAVFALPGTPAAAKAAAQKAAAPAPQKPSAPPVPPPKKPLADLPPDLDIDFGATGTATTLISSRPPVPPPATPPPKAAPAPVLGRMKPAGRPAAEESKPPPPPPLWDDEPTVDSTAPGASAKGPAETGDGGSAEVPFSTPPPEEVKPARIDPFAGLELGNEADEPSPGAEPASVEPSPPPEQPKTEEEKPPPEPEQARTQPVGAGRRLIVSGVLTGLVVAAVAVGLAVGPAALNAGGLQRLLGLGGSELVVVAEASGLYDTAAGKPVFFVRGRVENRGKRVNGPVRVVAVLLGDSGPAARAESVAGVTPTPEEIYGLRTSADADRLVKALAERGNGTRRLAPGATLPFFALFLDPPGDLHGHQVQVRLEGVENR